MESAQREFEEEVGIKKYKIFGSKKFIEKYVFQKKEKIISKTVTYFVALVSDKKVKIQKEEVEEALWLPHTKALQKIIFKERQDLLVHTFAYLKQ